jgi:hypothetical protein
MIAPVLLSIATGQNAIMSCGLKNPFFFFSQNGWLHENAARNTHKILFNPFVVDRRGSGGGHF